MSDTKQAVTLQSTHFIGLRPGSKRTAFLIKYLPGLTAVHLLFVEALKKNPKNICVIVAVLNSLALEIKVIRFHNLATINTYKSLCQLIL